MARIALRSYADGWLAPLYTIVGWREAGAAKYREAVVMAAGFAAPVVEPPLGHRYSWRPWDLVPTSDNAEPAPRRVGASLKRDDRRSAHSTAKAPERSHVGGANVEESRCRVTIRPLRLTPLEGGL